MNLPGAAEFLQSCRVRLPHGVGNAAATQLSFWLAQIAPLFDVVMDGNKVNRTKRTGSLPQLRALLGVAPDECAVFEDAEAHCGGGCGWDAGYRIGDPAILKNAVLVVPAFPIFRSKGCAQ